MVDTDRYDAKPLLLLLESYVLHAIGQLDPETDATAAEVVLEVFGGAGDWAATLRARMGWPDTFNDVICSMWNENKDTGGENNGPLAPEEFARVFVEQNGLAG